MKVSVTVDGVGKTNRPLPQWLQNIQSYKSLCLRADLRWRSLALLVVEHVAAALA